MTLAKKLGFFAYVATFLAIASIQGFDAARWALAPWPHFTLREHGRIMTRGLAEAPDALRPLLSRSELVLRDVRLSPDAAWLPVSRVGDTPWMAVGRLRAALRGLPAGSRVSVRVEDATGVLTEAEVPVDPVPSATALSRIGCFTFTGFVMIAFGAFVFWVRPESPAAGSFLLMTAGIGSGFVTQVIGGFPSRFQWLAIAGCYAAPAAGLAAVLTLERRALLERHPWIRIVPWLLVPPGVLVTVLEDRIQDDVSPAIRMMRVGSWAIMGLVLLVLRVTASSRREARRTEFYFVGMFLAIAPIIWAYGVRPVSDSDPPSPLNFVSLFILPLVIGYGIIRGELFDIDVVMRRGLAAVALLGAGIATYAGLVGLADLLPASREATRSLPVVATFAGVAFLVGGLLRVPLQRLVDRAVSPERFRRQRALEDAGAELAAVEDEGRVAERLVRLAADVDGLRSAAVFLARPGGPFRLSARAGEATAAPELVLPPSEPLVKLAVLGSGEINRHDFEANPKLAPLREACIARLDSLRADVILQLPGERGDVVGLLALGARADGSPLDAEDVAVYRRLARQGGKAVALSRPDAPTSGSGADPTEDRPVAVAPGSLIGHYRLEAEVGRGAMGAVFRAVDERLGRRVGIKFLAEDAGLPGLRERIRREARALAALDHPSIVRVHALEELGGQLFLVMEYLDGSTLQQELDRRGPLPVGEAVGVARCVAEALGHAFASGVLHRDVKPANVMRLRDGSVKLMDFGLARGDADADLTATGRIVGTFAYLAPELMGGGKPSAQSDLYALGVLLHVLVTGKSTVDGEGRPWYAKRDELDREALAASGVPEALVPVLLRLLRRSPADRHASPAELVKELDALGR